MSGNGKKFKFVSAGTRIWIKRLRSSTTNIVTIKSRPIFCTISSEKITEFWQFCQLNIYKNTLKIHPKPRTIYSTSMVRGYPFITLAHEGGGGVELHSATWAIVSHHVGEWIKEQQILCLISYTNKLLLQRCPAKQFTAPNFQGYIFSDLVVLIFFECKKTTCNSIRFK